MDWLHQAQTARQNHARRSQMKKLLVLSGFLDQKFAGNLKEVSISFETNLKKNDLLEFFENLLELFLLVFFWTWVFFAMSKKAWRVLVKQTTDAKTAYSLGLMLQTPTWGQPPTKLWWRWLKTPPKIATKQSRKRWWSFWRGCSRSCRWSLESRLRPSAISTTTFSPCFAPPSRASSRKSSRNMLHSSQIPSCKHSYPCSR